MSEQNENGENTNKAPAAQAPTLDKATIDKLLAAADKVPQLEQTVTALKTENTDLKSKLEKYGQDSEMNALKADFPDVPLELLQPYATLEAKREAAKKIQDMRKPSTGPIVQIDPKNPADVWRQAGHIGPSTDAEAAARLKEAEDKRAEVIRSGDPFAVAANIVKHNWSRVTAMLGTKR